MKLGQLAPAETTAAVAVDGERPGPSAVGYFLIAVAAGLTIWWLTRQLDSDEEEVEEDEKPAYRSPRRIHIRHDDDGELEGD